MREREKLIPNPFHGEKRGGIQLNRGQKDTQLFRAAMKAVRQWAMSSQGWEKTNDTNSITKQNYHSGARTLQRQDHKEQPPGKGADTRGGNLRQRCRNLETDAPRKSEWSKGNSQNNYKRSCKTVATLYCSPREQPVQPTAGWGRMVWPRKTKNKQKRTGRNIWCI